LGEKESFDKAIIIVLVNLKNYEVEKVRAVKSKVWDRAPKGAFYQLSQRLSFATIHIDRFLYHIYNLFLRMTIIRNLIKWRGKIDGHL